MFKKLRALLAAAPLVLQLALASPAGAFTQANISPGGAFNISSVTFQTFTLNSVGATTTCEEQSPAGS